jgi:hypothetical protein
MPQPTRSDDPDMALLFLGSWFEKLLDAPERDDATLDAVAAHIILDERPKTLLGLVITALAEKWLRRRLWMLDFDRLPPSDQGVRVVIDAVLRSCPPAGEVARVRTCGAKALRDGPDVRPDTE